MRVEPSTARAVRDIGVRSIPAVAVNGKLLDCCKGRIDEKALKHAGVGQP